MALPSVHRYRPGVGTGADTLYGGNGVDTFVIRAGDGGSAITDADTLTSFTDGTDIIGMSGLNYSDLTVEQGSGDYSSHKPSWFSLIFSERGNRIRGR
jgi:hypothetical protein